MGFIRSTKANIVSNEAQRAYAEGHTVFAATLHSSYVAGSGPVAGWAEMIESIENEGWTMASWNASCNKDGHPVAFPLFRRAVRVEDTNAWR